MYGSGTSPIVAALLAAETPMFPCKTRKSSVDSELSLIPGERIPPLSVDQRCWVVLDVALGTRDVLVG